MKMPSHRTEFLKVVNDCVILVDVNALDPGQHSDDLHVDLCTQGTQWFTDRHLQEVMELLRIPLTEYVKGVTSSKQGAEVPANIKGTTGKTPNILTGPTVRLIYKLKTQKQNYCILQNKENADMLDRDYTRVYEEKVSVFVQPILPKSPALYKQLFSAAGIKRSRVDISWYFSKGQSSTGSSQMTSSDQNLPPDKDSKTESDHQEASHSEQDKGHHRKTLRKIMKKADSRLSKHKKGKKRKISTDVTPDINPSSSEQTTGKCGGDEGTESDTNTLSGVSEIPHSERSDSEQLLEMSSELACIDVNNSKDKRSTVSLRTLTTPHSVSSSSFEAPVISHRVLKLRSESTMPENISDSTDFELPSLNSSCIERDLVDKKLPDTCATELEEADDNIPGNIPRGKVSGISQSKPRTDSQVKDEPCGRKSRKNICDNLLLAENTKDGRGKDVKMNITNTIAKDDGLLVPRTRREKDEFLKTDKCSCASSKPRNKLRATCTGATKQHIDSEETTNRTSRLRSKDKKINKSESKNLVTDKADKVCVKDEQEDDDDDLVIVSVTKSENPSGSKEKHDYKRVRNLSHDELKETVKKNESYLRAIFQGKSYCGRHQDYKTGGKKREKLMFQMFVGEFTDEQAMAVMDALRDMFCSRHDKYFDYVMRVLVAEMFVKIYMDMFVLSYAEAERAIIMPIYSKREPALNQTND